MSSSLKFVARGDALVRVPGVMELVGAPPNFVNRESKKLPSGSWGYPALDEPFACPSDDSMGQRLMKICRKGDLLPYDAETAARCGVTFSGEPEFQGGEWVVPAQE